MTFTTADLDDAVRSATERDDYDGYTSPLMSLNDGDIRELNTSLGVVTKFDGGPENPGDGHAIFIVVKVEGDDRLFRAWGYYSSWDSSELDGNFEVVEQYQRSITDYREVK
jgi:hypothetical protein